MSDDSDEQARRAKIARLKKAIVEGRYEVDPEAVAERMLARDVLKKNPALDEETLEMDRAVPDGDETGKARPADHEDTVSLSDEASNTASADAGSDEDDHEGDR